MSDYERDDFEITDELLANFADDSYCAYETDEKTIEQIREERYLRQEQRRLRRRHEFITNVKSYLMPALALVLLVSTVSYMNSLTFGVVVSYNDEQIGVVEDASVLREATSIIDSRIINKSLDSLENEPQYKVAVVPNNSDFRNSSELSQRIIERDNTLEDELCGVFVDDEFVGAVNSEEEAQLVFESILEGKKKDFENLGKVKAIEFNSSVVSEVGLYAKNSVVDKTELKRRLIENVELSYRVTVLQEQNVKIRYKTEYKADPSKPSGTEILTQKGVIGEGIATNESVYIDSEKISSEHVKVVAVKKPVNEIISVSPDSERLEENKSEETTKSVGDDDEEKDVSSDTSKETEQTDEDTDSETDTAKEEEQPKKESPFIWPVSGYVTGYFGYEGDHFHKGMDIGAGEGTPIYAAAAGTVVDVVFDYGTEGLGCYLTIDHGNGYQTTYAQCSALYASVGQTVEQGEVIGAVGSTGDSTGPHLHFRVIQYGEFIDPANFLY